MKRCMMFNAGDACNQQASFTVTTAELVAEDSCRDHIGYVVDSTVATSARNTVTVQRITNE